LILPFPTDNKAIIKHPTKAESRYLIPSSSDRGGAASQTRVWQQANCSNRTERARAGWGSRENLDGQRFLHGGVLSGVRAPKKVSSAACAQTQQGRQLPAPPPPGAAGAGGRGGEGSQPQPPPASIVLCQGGRREKDWRAAERGEQTLSRVLGGDRQGALNLVEQVLDSGGGSAF